MRNTAAEYPEYAEYENRAALLHRSLPSRIRRECRHTDDGTILHVVDRAPEGTKVSGTIDWLRRFDHMQQHTGQHVLSAAFDRLLASRTESFHLGAENSTIDLARELSAADIS